MNRLTDLNNYSTEQVTYEDDRPTQVVFDRVTPLDQTITTPANGSHQFPVGIDILDIVNFDVAQVYLEFDFSLMPAGAEPFIDNIPEGLVLSDLGGGIFSITGINNISLWNSVKTAIIRPPLGTVGTYAYFIRIFYKLDDNVLRNKSYTVNLTLENVFYFSNPAEIEYLINSTLLLNAPDLIVDEGDFEITWTLEIIPGSSNAIAAITNSGTGGTFSVNPTTKTVTIVGNKTQVNNRLDNLYYTFTNVNPNFSLTYRLSNNINSFVFSLAQFLKNYEIAADIVDAADFFIFHRDQLYVTATLVANNSRARLYNAALSSISNLTVNPFTVDFALLSDPGVNNVFYVNKEELLTGAPLIQVEEDQFSDLDWTVTIYDGQSSLDSFRTEGSGGTVTYFSGTSVDQYKIMTIVGTKAQINSHLSSFYITSKIDFEENINLVYVADFGRNAYTYSVTHVIKYEPDYWFVDSWPLDGAVIPTWQGRTFLSNQPNGVFADEFVSNLRQFPFQPNDPDYTNLTITLTASAGNFYNTSTEVYSNPITISGTYSTITDAMRLVQYAPPFGHSSNVTVSFTSTKDGVAGQIGSFPLAYAGAGAITPRTYLFNTPGSVSWQPDDIELEYGKLDYYAVGAGGGGSYRLAQYGSDRLNLVAYGGLNTSTADKKFGNASIYFDGVDDYAYSDSVSATDFTFNLTGSIDFWMKVDNLTGTKYLFEITSDTDPADYVRIYLVDGTLYATQKGNQTLTLSTSVLIEANTWVHVAYQHQHNGTHRLFTGGALRDSASGVDAQMPGPYNLRIGCDSSLGNFYKGYIDEIRFAQNPYVGLTSYTVPTGEYTYQTGVSNFQCIIHGNNEGAPIAIYNDNFISEIYAGHGGGGGEVISLINQVLANRTYTGTVGARGANGTSRFNKHGTDGANTVFETLTGRGGKGAVAPVDANDQFDNGIAGLGLGGASGTGFAGAGYNGRQNDNVGGGGGGDSGAGGVPTLVNSVWRGGQGGLADGMQFISGGRGGNGGGTDNTYTFTQGEGGKGYTPSGPNRPPADGAVFIIVKAK